MGYEVWADVLRLKGGHDWQRELEHALRHRSHKVLLVGTTEGVEKQGVRNELQIATDVGRRINDHNFIVPLKLSDFEKPFVIAHAQYIDFEMSWARGLAELARLLEEENVPRRDNPITETWMDLQLRLSGTVVQSPELLLSNWLEVDGLPAEIVCYDFKAGISIGYAESKKGFSRYSARIPQSWIYHLCGLFRAGACIRRSGSTKPSDRQTSNSLVAPAIEKRGLTLDGKCKQTFFSHQRD